MEKNTVLLERSYYDELKKESLQLSEILSGESQVVKAISCFKNTDLYHHNGVVIKSEKIKDFLDNEALKVVHQIKNNEESYKSILKEKDEQIRELQEKLKPSWFKSILIKCKIIKGDSI